MTTAVAKKKTSLSLSDKRWGFRLGCDGFVTKDGAAERLCVSKSTIDRMILRGLIRTKKFGPYKQSTVRVCKRSLEVFASTGER